MFIFQNALPVPGKGTRLRGTKNDLWEHNIGPVLSVPQLLAGKSFCRYHHS